MSGVGTPETVLYWIPGSCARVPLIALEEIGCPYKLSVPQLALGLGSAEYLAINPKGKVPTLVVDGRPISENPAIHTFLAESFPDANLLPKGDWTLRTDALSTMSWFAAGIHPPITRLRFPRLICELEESHDGIRKIACGQLESAFAILEARLGDREWLYPAWSIVDAYMLWLWFRATGSGMDGSKFPRCAAHAARCELRPSVARALELEESELARLLEAGELPQVVLPYEAGRARVVRQPGGPEAIA